MTSLTLNALRDRSSGGGLVLASLALNVFLLGLLAALYLGPLLTDDGRPDRSAAGRIERIAANLPPADAEVLRAEFRTKAATIDAARDKIEAAQEVVRQRLRAEPFDPGALRAAMGEARAARQSFFSGLNDVVTAAATRMSTDGRDKLAEPRRGR